MGTKSILFSEINELEGYALPTAQFWELWNSEQRDLIVRLRCENRSDAGYPRKIPYHSERMSSLAHELVNIRQKYRKPEILSQNRLKMTGQTIFNGEWCAGNLRDGENMFFVETYCVDKDQQFFQIVSMS